MPTFEVPLGVPTVLTQNVVYALPARLSFITSNAAIDISVNNSTWTALTNANTTGAYSSAALGS